jgi:drug/metabolite transporter (DMT)-like permease
MPTAPTATRRTTILADIGLFYAAAIWGSTFFVVKGVLDQIHPVTLVAYRFLIAGIIMLVYLFATGRPVFKHFGKGFLLAVVLWFLYVPQTIGLGITTASNSGFITGLFVAFVPLFLRLIFKRTPTMMELIASVISLLGLWVLTGGLRAVNTGDILTLAAAMTYALHLLLSDKYMKAGVDPYVISFQQFIMIAVLSFIVMIAFDLPFTAGTTATMGTVLFLTLFPTLTAFVIQMVAQRIVSPLRVSLIFALEPVFAGVFAWTLGGEPFILRSAFGGLLIFVALVLSGLPDPRRAHARQSS